MNAAQSAQMNQYWPWLVIAGVVLLFLVLRLTRKGLRGVLTKSASGLEANAA